jgi:YHS domain-containing protein
MVNDRFIGSEQIPVSVDGKTYYGCCAACKDKLQNNAAVRTALDPITQRPVDKATAVIGKTDSGKVLYFESEDTFARYGEQD